MPNRVIRGELLNSERYWSVGIEARQFFLHLILTADDFGLINGSSFSLRRNCFGPDGCDPKRLEMLLGELADQGLVVAYEIEAARFLWIPRFGNFPRAVKSRFPVTPSVFKELASELQCIRHADDLHVLRNRTASAPETETETVRTTTANAVVDAPGGSSEGLQKPAVDPVKAIFDKGVKVLAELKGEAGARSTIGKMRQSLGDDEVLALLNKVEGMSLSDPGEWLLAAANKARIKRAISKQNNGAEVIELRTGGYKCGVQFYNDRGERRVQI